MNLAHKSGRLTSKGIKIEIIFKEVFFNRLNPLVRGIINPLDEIIWNNGNGETS